MNLDGTCIVYHKNESAHVGLTALHLRKLTSRLPKFTNAFPVSENSLAALSVFRKTDRLVATPLLSAEVAAESASPRISRARRGGVTDLEFRGWNFASFTFQELQEAEAPHDFK